MKRNMFTYLTSLGPVTIADNGNGCITHLHLTDHLNADASVSESPVIKAAKEQIGEYLDGSRRMFDLPMDPEGTEFQRSVWKELCKVPFGTTVTYKELAVMSGRPKAARAVGMAMNRNPIAIIVPCHRVLGSNGELTGYAYGTDIKRKLLEMENAI